MAQDRAALIRKIAALMAKANDKGVTENEAASYLQKALDMLAKHNIEQSELNINTQDEVNIDETFHSVPVDVSWFSRLAAQVAKMYFCRLYMSERFIDGRKSPQHYYVFVGKVHHREIAISMYEYLMKTINRLANEYGGTIKQRNEFKKGAALRLVYRIYTINEANEKVNVTPSQGSTNLPALYSTELALADQFLSDRKFRQARKRTFNTSNAAFYDGAKAANGININNQLNGTNRGPQLKIGN